MIDRIMKAFTFKQEVYKEVEDDASFTQTAWMIVAVVTILSQLGSNAALVHVKDGSWLLSTVTGIITAVLAFVINCFAINWAGKTFFNADVTFEEMVRTLGLAYVWNIIGLVGILGIISPALVCMVGPVAAIAGFAGLAAMFIATKEALDLEWPQTIGTVIISWVISFIITLVLRMLIGGLFGL